MTDEEKEAILELKHFSNMTAYWKQEEYSNSEICLYIKAVLNLIEKQQKEIEELKKKCNSKYYHTIKCRELEKEINNGWKDKINKLKEEVETEQISNPYDFSYLLNELLGE